MQDGEIGGIQDRDDVSYEFVDGGRKKVYICLNHRVVYLCWIDAFRKGFIKKDALLFRIDRHADFWLADVLERELVTEQASISLDDETRLKEFVKTRMMKLNTAFLVLSMHKGIIGDAISIDADERPIYGEEKPGFKSTKRNIFEDTRGKKHTFYRTSSSMELRGSYGLLTDKSKYQDIQQSFRNKVREKNIILDLDFFTYQDNESAPWAMNDRNLTKIFTSDSFDYLVRSIDVITIALEPSCCGGKTECLNILEKLNSLVFNKMGINLMNKLKPTWLKTQCLTAS